MLFTDVYAVDQRLRSGCFGTVYTCHRKSDPDSTVYAVKVIDRQKLKREHDEALFREVNIMKEISHLPNVVQLIDLHVDNSTICMVQVYAAGGDVFDRLAERAHYNEKDARDLAKLLLETIHALHSLGIVHRDLKPENLLLKTKDDDASVLVADFGFARHVPTNSQNDGCRTRCGTPAFVAPEIVRGDPYDTKVDLWSTGCLLYILLGGCMPFQAPNHRALFRKIRAGDFTLHENAFKFVSTPAKQVISHLLTVSASKRWTAEDALQAEWFHTPSAKLAEYDLSTTLEKMRSFEPRKTWRSAAAAIGFAATAPFWISDKITFNQQLSKWDHAALEATNQEDDPTFAAIKKLSLKTRQASNCAILNRLSTIRFRNVYDAKKKICSGSFATVWEVVHKISGELYAAKIIKRDGLQAKDDEMVMNEVAIMQSLCDNKYVVHLTDFYEEDDYFYIIMEYYTGGDVFDRIVDMTQYTEKDARDLVKNLLKAVASLHKVGIAHRDLKPQNLLLESKDDNAKIKLADFGFARRVHTPESLTTRMGTPSYVAPEILKNIPHDERADLWSIGVVVYVLLVGYPPFMEEDQKVLFKKIRNGEWSFYEDDWEQISREAMELIEGLLIVDPKERWSIDEALRCSWINQDPSRLSSVNLTESMKGLSVKRKLLRDIARAMMWVGKESKPVEVDTKAQDFASCNSEDFNVFASKS